MALSSQSSEFTPKVSVPPLSPSLPKWLSKYFRLKKIWSSTQRLVSLSQREKKSCFSFVYSRLIGVARSLARPSSALTDIFFALLYTWSTLKVIKEPRLWNLERLGLESRDYHILAV